MIALTFEFDLVSPDTLALFERLPQALEGRSLVIDYRPVSPPTGHPAEPWVRLLVACGPGRYVCEQILRHWATGSVDAWALTLRPRHDPASATPPAASGPVPAVLRSGERFHGPDAVTQLLASLPPIPEDIIA